MAKKKISKKSKSRLLLFVPISLVIIGFFLFTSVTYAINLFKLSYNEKELQKELTALELKEKDLNTEILKLKDPEYIAKYAREKYYYTKSGEYVIKLEEKDEKIEEQDNEKDYTNYFIYGSALVLLIIFLFILKKRKSK